MMLAAIVDRQPLDGPVIHGTLDQMQHEVDWMKQVVAGPEDESADLFVDVGEAVAAIWEMVAQASPCSMRFVRETGVWTWADPVALGRAVRNLVENAVRAAGHGTVEVRVATDGREVVVEVHDSGPGFGMIRPQEQLGLITVRRFAAVHDGRLDVETSPLGGALVRLVLPCTAPVTDVYAETYDKHRTTA